MMIKEKQEQIFNWLKKFDPLENRRKRRVKKLEKANYELLTKKYFFKEFVYYLLLTLQMIVSIEFIVQTSVFWVEEYNYNLLFLVATTLVAIIIFFKMLVLISFTGSTYSFFRMREHRKSIGNQLKFSKYISNTFKIFLASTINGMFIGHRKQIDYDTLSSSLLIMFVLICLLNLSVYLIKVNEKAYQNYVSEVTSFLLIGGKLQGAEVGKYKFNQYSSVLSRSDLPLIEAASHNFDTSMIRIVGHSVDYDSSEQKALIKMNFEKADVEESLVEQTEYTFTLKIGDIPSYFIAGVTETKITSEVKQYSEGNWIDKLKLLIQSV